MDCMFLPRHALLRLGMSEETTISVWMLHGQGVCCNAGLLDSNDRGTYTVTDRLYEAEVCEMLDDLDAYGAALAEGPASPIATNIKLIKTCMQALPDLLAGVPPASCLYLTSRLPVQHYLQAEAGPSRWERALTPSITVCGHLLQHCALGEDALIVILWHCRESEDCRCNVS